MEPKKEDMFIDFNALLLLLHERGSELTGHMPRVAQRLFLSIDIKRCQQSITCVLFYGLS